MISAIVPNYNHGRFLERSIGALLSQDMDAFEIVVVDDASTDNSVQVLEKLAQDNPSIRLVRNRKNQGVTVAVQTGLQQSVGKYVCFAAADDRVAPGFFSRATSLLEQYPQAGLFCGDMALFDGETNRYLGQRPAVMPSFRPDFIDPNRFSGLLKHGDNQIVTGAAIFRREAIYESGGFDNSLGPFSDGFLARKIAMTRGFCYSPGVNANWYIFPDSLSQETAKNIVKAKNIMEIAKKKLADPVFPSWYAHIHTTRWRFAMSRVVLLQPAIDMPFVLEIGASNAADRKVLSSILSISNGKPGRFLCLCWLWFRLRPYRLRDLISTAVARRLIALGNRFQNRNMETATDKST